MTDGRKPLPPKAPPPPDFGDDEADGLLESLTEFNGPSATGPEPSPDAEAEPGADAPAAPSPPKIRMPTAPKAPKPPLPTPGRPRMPAAKKPPLPSSGKLPLPTDVSKPPLPRPGARKPPLPRPGSSDARASSKSSPDVLPAARQRGSIEKTASPPAVNPAGPARREPYPPAHSPAAPPVSRESTPPPSISLGPAESLPETLSQPPPPDPQAAEVDLVLSHFEPHPPPPSLEAESIAALLEPESKISEVPPSLEAEPIPSAPPLHTDDLETPESPDAPAPLPGSENDEFDSLGLEDDDVHAAVAGPASDPPPLPAPEETAAVLRPSDSPASPSAHGESAAKLPETPEAPVILADALFENEDAPEDLFEIADTPDATHESPTGRPPTGDDDAAPQTESEVGHARDGDEPPLASGEEAERDTNGTPRTDDAEVDPAGADAPGPELDCTESDGVQIDAEEIDASTIGADLFAMDDALATGLDDGPPPLPAPRPSNERPGAAALAEREATGRWHHRAEWAESMATTAQETDPDLSARNWLLASELWAMLGDTVKARAAARKATQAAPGLALAQRQSRALAAVEGDFKVAGAQLDGEARSAPTPEARAHAAFVSAQIRARALDDPENARRRLDLAQRAWPADPRPSLDRLVDELAASADPPNTTLATAPELEALARAVRVVARLRRAPPRLDDPPSPALAIGDAHRCVEAGDLPGAAAALEGLRELESLQGGVLWLIAALSSPSAETRPRAVTALRELLALERSRDVVRALGERALEQGSSEALATALASVDDDAFSPSDQVVLGSLGATGGEGLTSAISELAGDATLLPLAAAAARAVTPQVSFSVGREPERSNDLLGRRMMAGLDASALTPTVEAIASADPEDGMRDAFSLHGERRASDLEALARRIASWGDEDEAATAAAAVLAEKAGSPELAQALYASSVDVSWFGETAARALAALGADDLPDLLRRAAEALEEDDEHRGLLLYEAAIRAAQRDIGLSMTLCRGAARAAPAVPGIFRLGEQLARIQGDPEALMGWLRARRAATADRVAQALDAVREALLLADTNAPAAAALLESAVAARPEDVALRELAERLSADASAERGRWRETVAEKVRDTAQSAALLLEAALEYERAGARDDAARVATEAAHRRAGPFAEITAERLAASGERAAELSGRLLQRARDATTPEEQRSLYEQLYALDVARGTQATALMWHKAILEGTPAHLPSLRALEHGYIGEGRDDDVEEIAAALTRDGDVAEAPGHAALAARIRTRREKVEARRELVDATLARVPGALWALRDLAALGDHAGDFEAVRTAYSALVARGGDSLDIAAAHLRAAEAASRLGDAAGARALLDEALEAVPDYAPALASRAELRERNGDAVSAAEDYEALAELLTTPELVADARKRAGSIWLDHTDDLGRAVQCLEEAAALTPDDDDIFDRLQLAHVRAGDRTKLANLLQHRLERTTDDEQRVALEISRGKALADIGDFAAAREALDAALEANPEHTDALEVYANLCAAEGDHVAAEKAWIRLARAFTDPANQVKVYRALGELYTTHIDNPKRAERCFREVLKHDAGDEGSMDRLVELYVRLGEASKASAMQLALVERAGSPEAKRDRIVKLAAVFDETGDKKSAMAALEKARKAWPQDDAVLRAQAELHLKHGEDAAAKILLDRAANEARRALSSGRFDESLFATLVAVAKLRGGDDAANVAATTLAALEGRSEPIAGAGAAAGATQLDDQLAPSALSPALRSLLKKLAGVLDAAYPVDIRALKAAPPPAGAADFVSAIRSVASKMGIQGLDILVSPTMYATWLPASSAPPRLIVGQALLDARDDAAQKFALFRSLKILQANGAALTRLSPVDLGPIMAALLATFAKGWQPQGIDAKKLDEAKGLIEAARLPRVDDDVPTLALEVAGTLGARANVLGAALLEFGNRAALLATGDPSAGFRALSLAGDPKAAIPADGPERLKWIVKHPEARDIAVFSVSDAYAEARRAAGLSK